MGYFPCTNFYQIQLDVAKSNLSPNLQPFAVRLLESYQKRNAIFTYTLCHAVIAAALVSAVHCKGKLSDSNLKHTTKADTWSELSPIGTQKIDENLFWLYVTL